MSRGSTKVLSPACLAKRSPGLCFFLQNMVQFIKTPIFLINATYDSWECFFPQNMVQFIKTPIFLINAAYDSWEVKNILAPGVAGKKGTWRECKFDITKCSSAQLNVLQGILEGTDWIWKLSIERNVHQLLLFSLPKRNSRDMVEK
ncbi:hypothetical protein L2E82_31741 [Cichorium intybus]|uniref:Uncharacterized protein n=1 Tax=Cichorium intybus TaxID=13427 RepID=A0ACB9BF91_CICIN|nr:hypothetical protein L2E82_31741 [Cichorium intybus]